MSETEQEQQGAEQPVTIEEWPAPGGKLKKLREDQNLSQLQVAESLHLTVHYVNALEKDDYQKLPARTFVKGYLRAYAGLVGANTEEVLAGFERYTAARTEDQQQKIEAIRKRKVHDQSRLWLLGAAIIIVIFIALSWWYASQHDDGQSSQALPGTAATSIARAPTADIRRYNDTVGTDSSGESDSAGAAGVAGAGEITTPVPETEPGNAGPVLTTLAGNEPMNDENTEAFAVPATSPADSLDESSVMAQADEQVQAENPDTPMLADNAEVEATVSGPLFSIDSEQTETGRIIKLMSSGNDLLDIRFLGSSWIEVDNGDQVRLFNDILQRGDELHIQSRAPFNILVGDARQVEVVFNMETVDVRRSIRSDNSARINLEP